jgi:glucose-6-phosphate isomerase
MAIGIDYTNMMAPAVTGGLPADRWRAAPADFERAAAALRQRREAGELGFIDLPDNGPLHASIAAYAGSVAGRFDDVVVLGIGGSALGPIALRTALRPSGWNLLDAARREGAPRLHVLDNVDPVTIAATLDRLDLRRSLFVVTSKSGGTAETMAQYLVVRARLEEQLGEGARQHIVFVTDPEKGALRALARAEGISALEIPSAVGGRFSVLTPVGLLPAALIGIDTAALLAGSKSMIDRCIDVELERNPAGLFAMLQWMSQERLGRGSHVLMPYSDALRDMAAWFVQLWAESLGKIRDGAHVGPTPIAALGATDQHSQVQLFMEGPHDKTVTFIAVREPGFDVEIPSLHHEVPELGYLGGHRLGELLDVERRATAGALANRGRPNMTIYLDQVDPWHVGALFTMFGLSTVYAGGLYGVNPLDQPGVELGKEFTYAMLGRAGYDRAREEWNVLPSPSAEFQL